MVRWKWMCVDRWARTKQPKTHFPYAGFRGAGVRAARCLHLPVECQTGYTHLKRGQSMENVVLHSHFLFRPRMRKMDEI